MCDPCPFFKSVEQEETRLQAFRQNLDGIDVIALVIVVTCRVGGVIPYLQW